VPLATFVGLCTLCLWSVQERPRFSPTFDIGGGRTLRVWSIRRGEWVDIDPLTVYYCLDAGGQEVVKKTFLEHDDMGEYEFRMASADGGRLVCVYEVTGAAKNASLLLMFDAMTQESWPRTYGEAGGYFAQTAAKWRERYHRLKAANPELPVPSQFAKERRIGPDPLLFPWPANNVVPRGQNCQVCPFRTLFPVSPEPFRHRSLAGS
jgi:hypothetical protein